MNIDDIKKMESACITPAIAAKIIGCAPQYIRLVARKSPELLGFPVICIGSRVKIPRVPFIEYFYGNKTQAELKN